MVQRMVRLDLAGADTRSMLDSTNLVSVVSNNFWFAWWVVVLAGR